MIHQHCHRCQFCDLDWPPYRMYEKCQQCKADTTHIPGRDSMSDSEAVELVGQIAAADARLANRAANTRAFMEFYADRCAERFHQEMDHWPNWTEAELLTWAANSPV